MVCLGYADIGQPYYYTVLMLLAKSNNRIYNMNFMSENNKLFRDTLHITLSSPISLLFFSPAQQLFSIL